MELKKKSNNLPMTPGVYLMKDNSGEVIYVGKSKHLKARVTQYFGSGNHHSEKVKRMVKNAKDFEVVFTDTEFEALLLECKLIKEIKPRYNRMLKNHMKYNYIVINNKVEYPEVGCSVEKNEDYLNFGPFINPNFINDTITLLNDLLPLRKCGKGFKNKTLCSYYSLNKCLGPCKYPCDKEYSHIINPLIAYLRGKDKEIIISLKKSMDSEVEEVNFEKAAKYRDLIYSLEIIHKELMIIQKAEAQELALAFEEYSEGYKLYIIKGISLEKTYSFSSFDKLKPFFKEIYDKLITLNEALPIEIKKENIDEISIVKAYLNNSNILYYKEIDEEMLRNYLDFENNFKEITNIMK